MAPSLCAGLPAVFFVASSALVQKDLVDKIPGFEKAPFDVYSGFLDVTGPINGYDSLSIHYQFHTSQRDPGNDPLTIWHQGGPGGSSISGLFMEMGFFQVSDHGTFTNPFAWNRITNMLYLETPAGAGWKSGYSACIKNRKPVDCSWDDVTQAEAYALTLKAFFDAFSEYANHDMYLVGESYFGTSGPNIAHYILNHSPYNTSFKLKGMALGDACWDRDCCGPRYTQYKIDFYHEKGMFSKDLYSELYAVCDFPDTSGEECSRLMREMWSEIGPHNPENVYDNCPGAQEPPGQSTASPFDRSPIGASPWRGGYRWPCGGLDIWKTWTLEPEVRKALHLDQVEPGRSGIAYNISGPFALELYPELMKKIRILVYNGDADPSVPYQGIEDWIRGFEAQGILSKSKPWRPWQVNGAPGAAVAGSIATYAVPGSASEFSFALVRLAGHEVPTYMPEAALTMLSSFIGAQLTADAMVGTYV